MTHKSGLAFVPHLPSPPYPATSYTWVVGCHIFRNSMTKEKFNPNLNGAIDSLIGLTRTLCSNSFSFQYRFVIRTNIEAVDSHLDHEEVLFHNQVMSYKDKFLTDKEVIDLLWTNDKVPLWINASVLQSSKAWTTIELVTSRRLRSENELNKVADQFPPFHIQVPLPPGQVTGEKFDINWRTKKLRKKGLWGTIKRIVAE